MQYDLSSREKLMQDFVAAKTIRARLLIKRHANQLGMTDLGDSMLRGLFQWEA